MIDKEIEKAKRTIILIKTRSIVDEDIIKAPVTCHIPSDTQSLMNYIEKLKYSKI